MGEKKKILNLKLPKDPAKILDGPLKVIEDLGSLFEQVDNTVKTIDGRFEKFDTSLLSRLPERGFTERPEPKEPTHLSYEGQSEVDYCIECAAKHSQTAKVLLREAIQRAEANSPWNRGVLEKVRGAVEELCGFEDDTSTVKNERVSTLNSIARTLRKYIYTTGAEIGKASIDDLREIKDMTDKLVDAAYAVRESEEEGCLACAVEDICGENLECVESAEKSMKNVEDPEEIRKILRETRRKYQTT